jgi:hypothetical protein
MKIDYENAMSYDRVQVISSFKYVQFSYILIKSD